VVSLGAPGVAGADERSKDDRFTAQRDSDGRRSGYSHPDDDDYRYKFRRDRRYRDGYDSRPSGDPGYDRRARKREQECYDSYYYDPSFYNRYCRAGYYGDHRYHSRPERAPQTQSPSPDSTAPGDSAAPDANQQPGPDQSPPPTGHQHGTTDGSTPPDGAAPPPADSQPAPAAPSERAGASSNDRRDDRRPAWSGYATDPAGPAGPPRPAG
jgi:hypothetical protein